jgi:ketosteroid isomerase-like protein
VQSIESENLNLVKKLIASLATRDWQTVRAILDENVVFHFPGNNKFSGDYRGREIALELLARVAMWAGGSMRLTLHDVLANEQHGVLLYTVHAKRGDKAVSYRYVDIYHFRDGCITEVFGTCADAPVFDDFYSD